MTKRFHILSGVTGVRPTSLRKHARIDIKLGEGGVPLEPGVCTALLAARSKGISVVCGVERVGEPL